MCMKQMTNPRWIHLGLKCISALVILQCLESTFETMGLSKIFHMASLSNIHKDEFRPFDDLMLKVFQLILFNGNKYIHLILCGTFNCLHPEK